MNYFWRLQKPVVPCIKFQEVAPLGKESTTHVFCSRCRGRNKHTCDQHRPFWNHPNAWWAGRSWRVLSAFYKQLSQFLLWPAEIRKLLCKKCIISLTVSKLRVWIKRRHFGIFPSWAGKQTNSIEAQFVICMIKISVRFENNCRHISTTGVHKFRATLFWTVTPITCGSSLWNIC